MGGLVDEVGQPGQEQDAGAHVGHHRVAHEPAPLLRPAHPPDEVQRHDRAGAEEQSPCVRVQEQRFADREQDQVAPAPVDEPVDEGRRGEDAEQAHQLVHPRLIGVRAQERAEAEQDGGVHARAAAEQAPCGPHPGRDAQEPDHHIQPVRVGLTGAEQADPDVQEQVEERRRAVVAQDPRDRAQRVRGDAGGDRLVLPELAADVAGPEERRDHHDHDEQRAGGRPAGDALEPLRLAHVDHAGDRAGLGGGHGRHLERHLARAVCVHPEGAHVRDALVGDGAAPVADPRQQRGVVLRARLEDHVRRRR